MKPCIWYVSKYVSPPAKASAGGRGYLIMRELAKLGYNCVIITSDSNKLADVPRLDSPYKIEKVDGLQLCWLRTMKYDVAKSMRRVLSWFDFEWRLLRFPKSSLPRPDVVVVSSLSLLTVLNGFWWRKRFGCRLVVEIRDIWPLTIVEEGGFSRWNPFVLGLGFIEKLAYRYADELVGTMPNLQAHVTKVLGYTRPVHCVPMGVDETALAAPPPLPEDYRLKWMPQGKFVVAHVGSMGIANALDTFLLCARSLQDQPHIHFLLVGDGDLRKAYEAEYGSLPNITFAPKVPKDQVSSVLGYCDVVYFSVHVSEVWVYGQSLNKVIDYMLAGKPVVASYTGYPSMINEAQCGSFVPAGNVGALADEIKRYADMGAAEREAMGNKGREWLLANRQYRTLAQQYADILFPEDT